MAPARATARVSIVPKSEDTVPGNLILITSIANQLLEATTTSASQASEQVLAQLVEHFDLHYSFLRYSDHDIRASMLAAKWPPRSDVGDPDPFAVVSFTSDHPAFALCGNGQDLVMVHRGHENGGYRCPVTGRPRGGGPLVAAAPLISGVLNRRRTRLRQVPWPEVKPEAIDTLETVASLFAQFQARISAE